MMRLAMSKGIAFFIKYQMSGSKLESAIKWLTKKEKWTDHSREPRFYATDECDGCKLCYDECPTGHIKWINDRPDWEKPCLMCASCSSVCPCDAIRYGIPPQVSSGKMSDPEKEGGA